MEVAVRLHPIGEYYFSQKLREIEQLNKQGKNILNLGIGSPDLPPHPSVVQTLFDEAQKPNTHGYQNYKGSPVLRKAFADWYQKWYGVTLNDDKEILPLIGSKEGIMHICMTYLNEGDAALIPNPGYPTYSSNVKIAGGTCIYYDLLESNQYQPNFDEIENQDLSKVKLMFVNYPHMPTGQLATDDTFTQLIAFAKKHNILVIHDNPYSFILNETPKSLLAIEGAKEVVIELNSLSKSHNMAGWRVGVLCADEKRINEIILFKSNMDSGMYLPVQLAAAKALTLDKTWFDATNAIYKERRTVVYQLLDLLQTKYDKNQVGMFVWARIPDDYEDGYQLADEILYDANVFITPGGIFGSNGNKYVRISLCGSVEKFKEAINRINTTKMSLKKVI